MRPPHDFYHGERLDAMGGPLDGDTHPVSLCYGVPIASFRKGRHLYILDERRRCWSYAGKVARARQGK